MAGATRTLTHSLLPSLLDAAGHPRHAAALRAADDKDAAVAAICRELPDTVELGPAADRATAAWGWDALAMDALREGASAPCVVVLRNAVALALADPVSSRRLEGLFGPVAATHTAAA